MVTKNRRALELKLGKLGLIIFVSGMSVLLFSTFLLGMLVGKHLDAYPERYSGGLVDIVRGRLSGLAMAPQKREKPPSGKQSEDSGHASGDEAFDLTFYKTLGDKKTSDRNVAPPGGFDGVKSGNTAASVAAAKNHSSAGEAPAAAFSGKAAPVTDMPVLPDQKKLAAQSALPEASPLSALSAPDKIVKKGNFQVQVAAYRDVRQAEKMEKRLKSFGFATMIVQRNIPNKGKWFRVIAVDFADRQQAERASVQIAGKIRGVKCIIRPNRNGGA